MYYNFLWDNSVENPEISIITITYNSAASVQTTIDSVRRIKSENNLQYVVVDGGSTDGTLNILMENKDAIDVAISEPDKGISDAFNKGLVLARGRLIGIINSDDHYSCEGVNNVIKEWRKNGPGVYHGKIVFMGNEYDNEFVAEGSHEKSTYDILIHHPTVFVDNSVYKKFGGFDDSIRSAMDYELLLRFKTNRVNFFYIPEVVAYYSTKGVSNIHARQNLLESHSIRVMYGMPVLTSYSIYLYRCVKMYVRRLLHKCGMSFLVKIYRSKVSILKRS